MTGMMTGGMRTCLALLVCSAVAAGCDRGDDDTNAIAEQYPTAAEALTPVSFSTASAYLISDSDTVPLRVELALTGDQKAYGLMDRDSLPQDAGMVFLYDQQQPAQSAFWMYRTRIPLDIAFIDSGGTIRAIRHMEPCASSLAGGCPSYPSGAPFRSALEVNLGWFERHRIGVGDRVVLEEPAGADSP